MSRLIAACLLPAILSGCGLQGVGALLPVLEGGLGGLGGGSTSTLTLQIDQAHGTLTMGPNQPAMTLTPIGTPIPPALPAPAPPQPLPAPLPAPPPLSGGPIVTPIP